jgi:Flp pilus assembly protein TadG
MRENVIPRFPIAFSVATRRSQETGEKGTALVESAIVLTLFFTFLFGIMEFSRALYTYDFVSNAAREGTRYAMVRGSACNSFASACPASTSDVQNYLRNYWPLIDPNALTVTTTWTPNKNPGSVVKVQAQYNFQFVLPFLGGSGLTMKSASQMVISQ